MDRTPRHTWVPWVAALAGAAFTLKVTLILASDNEMAEGPLAVLYLSGLLLGVVAAVGAGLRQHGALRSVAVGGGSALLLVMWIMGLGDLLKPVVGVVSDAEHVQVEVPILLAGLVLLGLAWWARSRDLRLVDDRREPAVT
jgi:hypothetical protein